tara:strand:- start:591 stop:851 length:261 start_codon:yes stop_codon:yes gene_type:complete
VNSLAFPKGIARLCAEFGGACRSPLGAMQSAFHDVQVIDSKLIALVLKIYRPLLSSTGSGFCRSRFFFKRSTLSLACARQEGFPNV